MSRWTKATIRDLVDDVATWNPLRSSLNDTFNYIDLSAIDQDSKIVTGAREILCSEAPSRARQLVNKGDVLISTVRPNLNGVARVSPELDGATASTGFCVLRPLPDVLAGSYLFHWVKSPVFIDDMVRKATGASYPAVSDRIVAESQIPLPPLEEQKRIAEILDRAESLRAMRRQSIEHLNTLTQAIFLKMFGDPVTNPKKWTVTRLEKLIIYGLQNGLYKHSNDYGSGTPILRIDAFYDGRVTKLSTLKRVSISEDEQSLYGLHENDIVINRVNSMEYLGKSALIPPLSEPTVFESNIMRFSIDKKVADHYYFVEFLQSKSIKSQILTASKNAVNQSSINQQDVKQFKINLPPIDLQQKFAQRVEAIEKLKTTHQKSLTELDALFASLQHRAFKGEL
jgi:type I restriction enzyme, S subunit